MMVYDFNVTNAIRNLQKPIILNNTKLIPMKGGGLNVMTNSWKKIISPNIKGQAMEVSNINGSNAMRNLEKTQILTNTNRLPTKRRLRPARHVEKYSRRRGHETDTQF